MRYLRSVLLSSALLLTALISSQCRVFEIQVPNLSPLPLKNSGVLTAGMSAVDITPPPGLPIAGYSTNGKVANGVRIKLKARVLYVKPAKGRPVALVQCDLLAGSRLLHHKVASLIAPHTDVEAAGLLVLGTHTHSGPGTFFGSRFYNDFAASKAGFDADYFDFLSKQVARAVIQAYQEQRPAKIATGTIQIKGATYNRSLSPYLKNKHVKPDTDKYAAVNHAMHMIRVDVKDKDGVFKPRGAFSNFSIHPTAVSFDNKLYGGDVFSHIAREVEWRAARANKTPWSMVHVSANLTHGDTTPNHKQGAPDGYAEARRVGSMIGRKGYELFKSLKGRLKAKADVFYTAREVNVGRVTKKNRGVMCDRAAVATALVAGTEDRGTALLVSLPPFKRGYPRLVFKMFCQKEKRILLGPLQYLYLWKEEFPRHLFFQIIKIQDTVLLPLPFEVTTETGRRIAGAVKNVTTANARLKAKRFVVTSVSNGYWGYVTTPEEYARQHYEGGHTIYGPGTAAYLTGHLIEMAFQSGAVSSSGSLPAMWTFPVKPARFFPERRYPYGRRSLVSSPAFQARAKKYHEDFYSFSWRDVPPAFIDFHKPLIAVQVSSDGKNWSLLREGGRPVDDSSDRLAVIYRKGEDKSNMAVYEGRWFGGVLEAGKKYRFVIRARRGQVEWFSPAFGK